MADYNRNQDWDRNRGRYDRDNDYNQYSNYNDRDYNEQNRFGDMNRKYSSAYNSNRYNDYSDYDQQGNRGYGGYGASNSGHNYGNQGRGSWENDRNYGNYGSNYGGAYGASGYFNDMGKRSYEGGYSNTNRNYGSGYSNRGYGSDYDRRRYTDDRGNDKRDWWDRAADEVASWFGDDDAERRRRRDKAYGPHKGKGPKGYKRSDERIKDDINDRLSDDDYVDASDIDVTVEEGNVILSGTVENRHVKRRAEDIAEAVSGVTNVENRLRVARHDAYVGSSSVYSAGSSTDTNTSSKTGYDKDRTV